jgi:hypothetical protein
MHELRAQVAAGDVKEGTDLLVQAGEILCDGLRALSTPETQGMVAQIIYAYKDIHRPAEGA